MTCYSDHNEDVRTKGACDYCQGTEVETSDVQLCTCAYCATSCPCVEHEALRVMPMD